MAVLALGAVALLFAAMSLGPRIFLNGINTGVPGIWAVLHSVPVLNSAVPTRWAMAIAPVGRHPAGARLQRATDLVKAQPSARGPVRVAMITAVAMALVPLVPTPLQIEADGAGARVRHLRGVEAVRRRRTTPWSPCRCPTPATRTRCSWSADTGQDMRIAGAYALLPNQNPLNPNDRTALFSPPWRPTSGLMASIRQGNPIPEISDTRREMTLADLRYWKAGVIVLTPQVRDIEMLRAMTDLLGFEPTWVGGAWVWDVRSLVDDPNAVLTGPDIG